MDHSKKSTYLFSIDALRVIAILAVILIHVTTNTLASLKLDVEVVPFSLFLNQVSRFAVPLFFLISGFVLELNNKSTLSYSSFFKRRASRIIAPFIFWSVLYFLVGQSFQASQLLSQKFFWALLSGSAAYHLYFIPTLILFYLAFPWLHLKIGLLKKPLVLTTLLAIQGILLYRDYYQQVWELPYDIRIALLSYSMFILGMVASHNVEKIYRTVKKYLFLLAVSLCILVLFIFFHVYEMTTKLATSRFIYNQFGPLNYVYTTILASILFYVLERTQFAKRIFITMSKLSFFVFFIHVLVLDLLWDNFAGTFITSQNIAFVGIWFDFFMFALTSSISFGIAYLVHKIPKASKITG